MKRTKTLVKIGIAACALGAANAFAFYGTEIENYKPNPWLERSYQQSIATPPAREPTSPASGATRAVRDANRPASEAVGEPGTATTESAIERFWHEADRASRFGGN